jgi:hypothetical protein
VVSKILKTPALDYPTLLLNKCPLQLLFAFSRRVGASVFAKNNSPLGDRREIEGLRFSVEDFQGKNRPKFARFLGKTTVEIAIFRRLYRSFCKLPVFYCFFLTYSQILAKSSCGVSPVHLPHEIGGKKPLIGNLLVTVKCYFCQFCIIAKVAMINRQIFERKFLKHPSIFLATLHEACIEIWQFFLNFGRIMAIENLNNHMILSLFNFYYIFLAI